jgi:hypothetical protein
MLEGFEVRDIPEAVSAMVAETTPLRVVANMVRGGALDVVLMRETEGRLRGVVRGDSVLRLAARIPEAPVGLLPIQCVIEVTPFTPLLEALRLVSNEDIAGLALPNGTSWRVVLREGLAPLTDESLKPIVENREKRISGIR